MKYQLIQPSITLSNAWHFGSCYEDVIVRVTGDGVRLDRPIGAATITLTLDDLAAIMALVNGVSKQVRV